MPFHLQATLQTVTGPRLIRRPCAKCTHSLAFSFFFSKGFIPIEQRCCNGQKGPTKALKYNIQMLDVCVKGEHREDVTAKGSVIMGTLEISEIGPLFSSSTAAYSNC